MRTGIVVALILTVVVCGGCGSKGGWQKAAPGELPLVASPGLGVEREYALAVGDEIALLVVYYEDFNAEAVVRPDGKVTFPGVGEIQAAGFTPSDLDSIVTGRLSEIIVNPDVTIVVKEYSEQLVYVLGEVERPGAFPLQQGMTVVGAISSASGATHIARLSDVVLIRRETPYSGWGAKLDLERLFEDGDFTADVHLQAYDIIYVPKTKIGSVSVFLDTFFRPLAAPLSTIVRGYELATIDERRR